jgi:hypothetical protein
MRFLLSTTISLFCATAIVAAPEGDVLHFLPADTEMVAYVNVQQLVGSALVKKHALEPVKSALKDNKEAQRALEALGLDPFHDIRTLHLFGPASNAPRLLLVVRGSFDVEKLNSAAEDYGKRNSGKCKVHRDKDLKVYEITENGQTAFVLVLDKETILIALTRESLLEAARRTEPGLKNEQLLGLLKEQDNKQSLWTVALATDELKKQAGSSPQTAALAEKLTSLTGRIIVTDVIQVDIRVNTTDPRSAANLSKLLGDLKGVAVFATQNIDTYGQLISSLIDTFKIAGDKSAVTLSATITEEVIEKGLKKDR